MCLNPRLLDNGIQVDCYKCMSCLTNRKYDLVGRAMAEHLTAKWTLVGTLTYGGDDRYASTVMNMRAKVLHYEDVQTYLKALRNDLRRQDRDQRANAKSSLRYMIAGEYGSAKGRAHWHVVLMGDGNRPRNIVPGKRYMHSWKELFPAMQWVDPDTEGLLWRHGWTQWAEKPISEETLIADLKYNLKYAVKDQYFDGDGSVLKDRVIHQSTNPLLGAEWLKQYAREVVGHGLPLHNGRIDIGPVKAVKLSGAAQSLLCAEYARAWRERYGNDNWPNGVPDRNGVGVMEKWADRNVSAPDPDLAFRLQRGRIEAAQAVRRGKRPQPYMAVTDDRIRTDFLAEWSRVHRFDDDDPGHG